MVAQEALETFMNAFSRRLVGYGLFGILILLVCWGWSVESVAQTGGGARKSVDEKSSAASVESGAGPSSEPLLLGRLKYDQNNGNDCANVGKALVDLVSKACTLNLGGTRTVELASPDLLSFPFLFMNGHDRFQFSEKDRQTLRNYFENGGFLLASGCCDKPDFPISMRRELSRLFEGPLFRGRARFERMPYDHLIYRIQHTVEKVTSLNRKRDIYLEGLFLDGRLVAVLCDEGLCCSFSMGNRCNKDRGVPPELGPPLAVNIAIYALTH